MAVPEVQLVFDGVKEYLPRFLFGGAMTIAAFAGGWVGFLIGRHRGLNSAVSVHLGEAKQLRLDLIVNEERLEAERKINAHMRSIIGPLMESVKEVRTFMGMRLVASPDVPKDEVRIVDATNGKVLKRIVNLRVPK